MILIGMIHCLKRKLEFSLQTRNKTNFELSWNKHSNINCLHFKFIDTKKHTHTHTFALNFTLIHEFKMWVFFHNQFNPIFNEMHRYINETVKYTCIVRILEIQSLFSILRLSKKPRNLELSNLVDINFP